MRHLFIAVISLIVGTISGYWLGSEKAAIASEGSPPKAPLTRSATTPVEPTDTRLDSEMDDCKLATDALVAMRDMMRRQIENAPPKTHVKTTEPHAMSTSETPTEEQKELYAVVEQRLYAHASSGKPLVKSITSDPDFQRLTADQQRRIGQEIATRYNNGELTWEQIHGQ